MAAAHPNRQKAYDLLSHYFELFAKHAGVRWTNDNDAEVAHLVDLIFDYTDERVDTLEEKVDQPDWRDRR